MRYLSIAFVLCAACGDDKVVADAKQPDSATPIDSKSFMDAPGDVVMNLTGGANALRWDAATSTLYLTDNTTDTLVKWTAAGGLQVVGTFPPDAAGVSLGGLVKQADGSVLCANFGFGMHGNIYVMTGGTGSALTGLDTVRKRIDLGTDSSGVLYETYFTGNGANPVGGIASVTIAAGVGTEVEIVGGAAGGMKKVIGVAATPTALYVSDQTLKQIWKIARPGTTAVAFAMGLPTADLMLMMPNGDLLTGGGPVISRITPTGTVSALANTGFEQVRGMAYDAVGHRLFVVDHSATVGTPDKLHIQPLAN